MAKVVQFAPPPYRAHAMSDIHPDAQIGHGSTIWQFVVVMSGAKIGRNCNISAQVLIEGGSVIGDNVTVKSGAQIWEGVHIGDDAFVGPNVTFTNDIFPRSKNRDWKPAETIVQASASIGANATILAGVTIGRNAMVGAGSVVTKDVPPNTVVIGNPARVVRCIDQGALIAAE